jgi:hypothetical protein
MALSRHLVAAHIRSVGCAAPFVADHSPAAISPRFNAAVVARHVFLTTYRELIAPHGLEAVRRPAG